MLGISASGEMLFVQIYLIQMCDQQATFLIIRVAKFHYKHNHGIMGPGGILRGHLFHPPTFQQDYIS